MVIITETINDFFVGGGKMVTIVYLLKKNSKKLICIYGKGISVKISNNFIMAME